MTHYSILCILITTLANVDILVARLLFPSEISGAYAAVSTLSKGIVFLSGLIESVYFPQLVRITKHTGKLLLQALATYGVIFVGAIFFIFTIGDIVLDLVKSGLHIYIKEFTRLLLWGLLVSLITFSSKILLGWRMYSTNLVLFTLLITILLTSQYIHFVSLQHYIYSLCVVCGVGVLFLGIYLSYTLQRKKKQIIL